MLVYNRKLFCVRQTYNHSCRLFLKKILLHLNIYSTKQFSLASTKELLHSVLELQNKSTSNSFIDNNVRNLCNKYKILDNEEKKKFLLELACNYGAQQDNVTKLCHTLTSKHISESQMMRIQDKLKVALTPQYQWLFVHIGRQENGVKFLVDMRTDILISDYEAVHPVRSWTDLKKRMGADRRCFVYTHSSMPDEPLVILHTVLRKEIANSTTGIVTQDLTTNLIDFNNTKAATFYSISSTQKGLQGIELGNYIIKRVATEIAKEFPQIDQFSTLSPIPKFKSWLFECFNCAKNDSVFARKIFSDSDLSTLETILKTKNIYKELMKLLSSNNWLQIADLVSILERILLKMCIRYLYLEKKRGYALDNVANFHLRNGAEMWRINWMADLTPRGLSTSCGIMVNYRYYLDKTDNNSRQYIENKFITISPIIQELLKKNII